MAGAAPLETVAGPRRGLARRLWWGLVAAVGYILSPLSPWNDAFVNVPIAYAVAKLLHVALGLNEFLGFQLGYAASNAAGLALMALSGQALLGSSGRKGRKWLLKALLVSSLYGVAASLVLASLGLIEAP